MGKVALYTWLITGLLGTAAMALVITTMTHGNDDELLPIVALVGGVLSLVVSIPAMLIYHVIIKKLRDAQEPSQAKLIASVYALAAPMVLISLVLSLLGNGHLFGDNHEFLLLSLPYSLTFLLCVWVVPWPVREELEY